MSGYVRYFYQCWLQRGNAHQMAWLPEKYVVMGRFLRLMDEDVWDDGWQVTSVGARMTEANLRERDQDYKQTRKASDV